MNTTAMRMQSAQQQALSPRLQRAVKLLQMSSIDFAQALSEAAQANPFLEIEPGEEAGSGTAPEAVPVAPDAAEAARMQAEVGPKLAEAVQTLERLTGQPPTMTRTTT